MPIHSIAFVLRKLLSRKLWLASLLVSCQGLSDSRQSSYWGALDPVEPCTLKSVKAVDNKATFLFDGGRLAQSAEVSCDPDLGETIRATYLLPTNLTLTLLGSERYRCSLRLFHPQSSADCKPQIEVQNLGAFADTSLKQVPEGLRLSWTRVLFADKYTLLQGNESSKETLLENIQSPLLIKDVGVDKVLFLQAENTQSSRVIRLTLEP